MRTYDVLLGNRGSLQYRQQLAERFPPLSKQIEIRPGVMLAAIDSGVAHVVFHACKSRQLDRGDDQILYGFVRPDPPGARWDADSAISEALHLSHFVHGHTLGFEYAARLDVDDKKRVVALTPADVEPTFFRAYPSRGVERLWLTQEDGELLKVLIARYGEARDYLRDKRVGTAISLFSQVPFISFGRPRAALLAAALEGLVSTSPERALKQFTVRVPALAQELGLAECDKKWAERAYKLRSKLAHGARLLQVENEMESRSRLNDMDDVIFKMDELLRRILTKALLDREFAHRLEAADRHWPVAGKGCVSCCGLDQTLSPILCPRCGQSWT